MWLGQIPITSSSWSAAAVIKRRRRSCLKSRSGSACPIRQGLKLDFTYNTSHLKRPPLNECTLNVQTQKREMLANTYLVSVSKFVFSASDLPESWRLEADDFSKLSNIDLSKQITPTCLPVFVFVCKSNFLAYDI